MNGKNQHILATASNLIGFTFFVLVSVKTLGLSDASLTLKLIASCIFLLAVSCLFSFASIRRGNNARAQHLEQIADYVFIVALLGVCIIAGFIAFDLLLLQ